MSNEISKDKKVANVPNLRFVSFSQPWKRSPLKSIVSFSKGSGISKSDLSEQGRNCILYGQLYTDYSNATQVNQTTLKTSLNQSDLVISQAGQVLIPASGETHEDISNSVVINVPGVLIGSDINILTPKQEILGSFLACCFRGVRKKQIASLAQGNSVVHLNSNNLSKLIIDYPSIDEQARITTFIRLLEARIEAQNKIIKESKVLKKSINDRLLFQNTKLLDRKSLSTFGTIKNGYAFKSNTFESGPYRIITISNVSGSRYLNDERESFIRTIPNDIQPHQLLRKKDILISLTGNVGRITYVDKECCLLNQRVGVLSIKPEFEDLREYLFQVLSTDSFENSMISRSQGAAQKNIGNSDVDDFQIPFSKNAPYLKQVANLLKSCDDVVLIETKVLKSFEKEKKYLLGNLFI